MGNGVVSIDNDVDEEIYFLEHCFKSSILALAFTECWYISYKLVGKFVAIWKVDL